ncbi:sensor histidine kinase [Glycomyces albidus]|uniref:histidine kinase n=1 Tax=Glycomyces albidus TaxID=2656774 RepID=A0A6L5G4I9_9ACTN|nr:sensor histidine kinase [Glycomyces albidus]MQM24563.1 two-component sensor histidine kinase [Glycomyces albidus]
MTSPPGLLARVRRGDLIAAVLLFPAGSLLIGLGNIEQYMPEVPLAVRFIPLALVCLGVVVRRAAPAWCLAVGTVGFGIEIGIGLTLATVCVYTDNLYAYARYGPPRKVRVLLPTVAAGVLVLSALTILDGGDAGEVVSVVAIGAVVLLSPIATGVIVRQAHDRAELERERAEQTARLADVRRREAVLRERTLMARELHDTVANFLSAIALQSTALQSRKDLESDAVRGSIDAIRASSVDGLAELRRIIGILRAGDEGEELASYRIDQIPELAERMRAVGLKVDFHVEGPPRDLPGEVELTAYRVVQEALTNALKHGRDAEATVRFVPGALVVSVVNALGDNETPVPGAGAGLVGMTERVRLLGGKVHAGPEGEHWTVRAEIPTGGDHRSAPGSIGTADDADVPPRRTGSPSPPRSEQE